MHIVVVKPDNIQFKCCCSSISSAFVMKSKVFRFGCSKSNDKLIFFACRRISAAAKKYKKSPIMVYCLYLLVSLKKIPSEKR